MPPAPRRRRVRTPEEEARSKQLRKERNHRHYIKKRGAAGNHQTAATTTQQSGEDVQDIHAVSSHPSQGDFNGDSEPHSLNATVAAFLPPESSVLQAGASPLRIPSTSTPSHASRLVALNEALLDWGYMEDRAAYSRSLDKQLRRARRADKATRTTWVNKMDEWIADGDSMVEELQDVARHDFNSTTLSVVFNVLYMIAAAEARLYFV
ncbi:hypothetical protein OH76DRAFT_1479370 [Lentinus brumalis]|uniref:Uncharacterized protein n=1 Tax=Lentinus brumalis TaxID=2498619 RepID=A0A371DPB5_9APHY|nr:hypothetical protein OH76DRAFT_1479370 [Polyporus brumalis]